MSERDNRPLGQEGEVLAPRPEDAAQDPQNAARQEQVKRDAQANREQQERVNASVSPEVRDRPVGEIVRDAEQRAERERQR
jgi:hypothetical protein